MLDKVKKLCDENNQTLIGLERELGFGNGTIRRWNKSLPSIDKAQKVAEYFGVTLDYLTGRTDDPHGTAELTDEEQQIFDALMKGRVSKNPAVKALASALSKILDIDEE